MQQNINWMRYLTLGISLIVLKSTLSCKRDIDYVKFGTYVYINNTDSVIQVRNAPHVFTVNAKESYTIEESGDGSKYLSERNYVAPFTGGQVLLFGNLYCDTLLNIKESITGIENYKSEKVADRHYKFTYTFTQADIDKAVPCE